MSFTTLVVISQNTSSLLQSNAHTPGILISTMVYSIIVVFLPWHSIYLLVTTIDTTPWINLPLDTLLCVGTCTLESLVQSTSPVYVLLASRRMPIGLLAFNWLFPLAGNCHTNRLAGTGTSWLVQLFVEIDLLLQ